MGLFCCKDWPDRVSQAFPGHPLPKHSCWAYGSAASLSLVRRSFQNQGNTFWGMSLFEAFVFGFNQNFLNTLKAKLLFQIGPGHPAQLVRDLPWYTKVAGSIPPSGHIQESNNGPGWCGSVDWALACKPRGCWFESQSGHMPGLQALRVSKRQLIHVSLAHWCFSPVLRLFLKVNT